MIENNPPGCYRHGRTWPADTLISPNAAMKIFKPVLLLMANLSLFSASSHGAAHPGIDDWPMFRGQPSLTGIAAGKLSAKLELKWSYKTGAEVKSSPTVSGGRVFVGSFDEHLHAIDLESGKGLWKFKTDGTIESSPLFLDGKVFFGSEDGKVRAVNAADGKLVWERQTEDKVIGAPNWVRNPKGGKPWVLVGSHDYFLYCFDSETGKTNWSYETGNYINGSPAVEPDLAVTAFGGCDAILHVINVETGEKVKEIDAGAYVAGSAALTGGRAYFGHYENEYLCIDLQKGTNIWTYRERNFPFFSSPAVTKDRVIFGGRDKRLHCVDRADGKQIWTFSTRGKVDSSPVVCDGKVVVGSDDGRLYVVSLETGKEIWNFEIGEAVTSSPAIVNGHILVGSDDGNVYCFGPK
jgi:outer membrane protein assembly factor BamB